MSGQVHNFNSDVLNIFSDFQDNTFMEIKEKGYFPRKA